MNDPHVPQTGRPPTRAPRGVVSTPHYFASGGDCMTCAAAGAPWNAAITANAALWVLYPHMEGLVGDGFWLIAEATGRVHGINASGTAARLATRDFYRPRSRMATSRPLGLSED